MIRVCYSPLNGTIDAIPSKSYAHRALFLASLSDKPTVIKGKTTGIDTDATIDVLKNLGADIRETVDGYVVSPIINANKDTLLNVHESGSTLRFLLPLLSVLGVDATVVGEGRLAERPNEELIRALTEAGASYDGSTLPLKTSGKISADVVSVRADISSQYVSGLLMSLQTLSHPTEIRLKGELKSKNYVDITLDCMRVFGVEVEKTDDGFRLPGGGFRSPSIYTVEGDWSNSAFWLVSGAINGKITVNNLNIRSFQGDKAIIDILKKANAKVTVDNSSVTVEKSPIMPFTYDMEDVPDLVPVTAVLASYSSGKCVLTNIERLRFKESDRIQSTVNLLSSVGIYSYSEFNKMIIEGGKHCFGRIDGANDHRIVMSACIVASGIEDGAIVGDENAVEKSYKSFYKDFNSLGGIIENA